MDNLFDDIDLNPQEPEAEELSYAQPPETVADGHINEALRRIEQAQLYKMLLSHSLFAPGSARPEVQAIVEAEIRAYVLNRLEILVGVRQETSPSSGEFSAEEISALKALAGKVLGKAPAVPAQPVPKLNPIMAPANGGVAQVGAPAAPRRPVASKKRRTENLGEHSKKDLSQAVPSARRPIPMPNQNRINQITAQSTNESMASMDADPSGQGGLLKAIAQMAIKQNANLPEEP